MKKMQRSTAQVYGEILDMPFPNVRAEATTAEIRALVEENLEKIKLKA